MGEIEVYGEKSIFFFFAENART